LRRRAAWLSFAATCCTRVASDFCCQPRGSALKGQRPRLRGGTD